MSDDSVSEIRQELSKWTDANYRKYNRFLVSALSSIPWIGGFFSASAALHAERNQEAISELQVQWLKEHEKKLQALAATLDEMVSRLDQLGEQVSDRLQEESYLTIVEQGFRLWDTAATEEKRELVRLLLTNAGGTTLCSDDVVRLFISWIEKYHEIHFAVIREIYDNPGSTRAEIWQILRGGQPREDSADADLFKLLIRDLSTGGVIRQSRDKTAEGKWVKKRNRRRTTATMKSAFDETDRYELTELGKQFVHYTMNDVAPRLTDPAE